MTPIRQSIGRRGSSLPKLLCSAISPTFIARLIKGCRGDACWLFPLRNNPAFSTL
jgi:hypothetical protein